MELKFALLGDAANESKEGKLNLIGEFNTIRSAGEPVGWPALALAARFEASVSEGTQHRFQIGLFDSDGQSILPLSGPLPLAFQNQGPGRPLRGQVIIHLVGLMFPKFGDYSFHLLVDGRLLGEVPVYVMKAPTPPRPHGKKR